MRDPSNLSGMDLLAFLFWWQANLTDLDRLTRRLADLNYNETRPEAWIGMIICLVFICCKMTCVC
jgi:hypothetical protein